jgi:hypothetical protein
LAAWANGVIIARARAPDNPAQLSAKISESKFLACNHETLFTLLRARFEMFYTQQRAAGALLLSRQAACQPYIFFPAMCCFVQHREGYMKAFSAWIISKRMSARLTLEVN